LYWVCLTSPQQIDETDHTRFREAVDSSCKRAGYNITSSFMMKPLSVGVVMATVADAKRLIEATSITLDCEPPLKLSTAPFRQINIAWAFELVIGGVSSYDCTFICYLDKYLASRYSRDGQSLLHSSRVVEEDFYCFVMFDWETTSRVLYHFDRKFTGCYALRVNLLSSMVHEPKLPLRKIFKFMYREFEGFVTPLWVCNMAQQTAHARFC
jgi:hypothetical protein